MELIKKYLTNKTKIVQLRKEIINHEHKIETEIDFNKQKNGLLKDTMLISLKKQELTMEKLNDLIEKLKEVDEMEVLESKEYLETKKEYDTLLSELFEEERILNKEKKVEALIDFNKRMIKALVEVKHG